MGRVRLRRATPADAAAIAEIPLTARRGSMPRLAVVHSDEETGRWVREVVMEEQEGWVAVGDGEEGVLGIAALGGATREQLYVHQAVRGRGIGGALLARAKERRPGGLDLWTFQRNGRARAFHENRGFDAVEFGDGAGNEEREPDVRYR